MQAEYEFTLRGADGTVELIRETHRLGAFSRGTWARLLAEAGFLSAPDGSPAGMCPARRLPGRRPDNLFTGHRQIEAHVTRDAKRADGHHGGYVNANG